MWPWNVVTWSCLSRIQWRKESVTRPSFMQSSHRIDMAGWHSEWVTVQSGSGALFWWLHDDGDGLGPVGVKWERSQGFADSRTMKSPAAGGCSGSPRLAATDRGPSIQLTASILEKFISALVTWFCFSLQSLRLNKWTSGSTHRLWTNCGELSCNPPR